MTLSRRPAEKRRIVALVVLACLSVGSAAGLVGGLVSCAPADDAVEARPLTATEARRLADMRVTNYRDERAGIRATWGDGDAQVSLAGWVDWRQALTYVRVGGPGAGDRRGLLQAVPGLVATRPAAPGEVAEEVSPTDPADATKPVPPIAEPPAAPPADGWRVRPWAASGKNATPLDAFLSLVFVVASTKPDQADLLAKSEARWLGQERLSGTTVDVLLGPAVPPQPLPTASPSKPAKSAAKKPEATATATASPSPSRTAPPTALKDLGGGVRYWLDSGSTLRRFEALLPGNLSVRADLDHADKPKVTAVAAFGGAPVKPRALNAAEENLLATMRQRNLELGGGKITVTLPTMPPADLRGEGWIDWTSTVAYLALHDIATPKDVALMRADLSGVAFQTTSGKAVTTPPLPAPYDGWQFQQWSERGDARGSFDIDLLLGEALGLASPASDDGGALADRASWLRKDRVGKTAVTVFEIAKPAEQGNIARGQARLRYWVDKTGALRRLEARTRTGAFAQLDITAADVPYLPTGPLG